MQVASIDPRSWDCVTLLPILLPAFVFFLWFQCSSILYGDQIVTQYSRWGQLTFLPNNAPRPLIGRIIECTYAPPPPPPFSTPRHHNVSSFPATPKLLLLENSSGYDTTPHEQNVVWFSNSIVYIIYCRWTLRRTTTFSYSLVVFPPDTWPIERGSHLRFPSELRQHCVADFLQRIMRMSTKLAVTGYSWTQNVEKQVTSNILCYVTSYLVAEAVRSKRSNCSPRTSKSYFTKQCKYE